MSHTLYSVMSAALITLFAAVSSAGLFASTTNVLGDLAPVRLSGWMLIPGLLAIGALVALASDDPKRGSIALAVATPLGTLLFAAARAAPGAVVDDVRVRMINDATIDGMGALLLMTVFCFAGLAIAFAAESLLGRPDV